MGHRYADRCIRGGRRLEGRGNAGGIRRLPGAADGFAGILHAESRAFAAHRPPRMRVARQSLASTPIRCANSDAGRLVVVWFCHRQSNRWRLFMLVTFKSKAAADVM